MKKKLLYIITARGGSKRLPNKNIKLFCKKPLLHWTVIQALRLAKSNDVVLSTEDLQIKKKCKHFKSLNIIDRPKKLASSKASSIDVVRHVLKKINFEGNVILLQPTSPLRSDSDILKGMKLLDKYPAVMSQTLFRHEALKINKNLKTPYFNPLSKKKIDLAIPNGAFFGATTKWIKNNDTFFNKSVITFNMPYHRSVDIDYEIDFIIAEKLFKNNNTKT